MGAAGSGTFNRKRSTQVADAMNGSARAQLKSHLPHKVSVAQIQHELDGLWESLYQQANEDKAVTRACMSNLIIYCDDEQIQAIEQAIPAIVQVHSARLIVLSQGKTDGPGIEDLVCGAGALS